MQQFTVPQFIDVEDKVIGPITARQFIIIFGSALLIGLCYKIFQFSAFVFSTILISSTAAVFSFVKINGMPFHFFLLNFVETSKRSNIRIWNNYYGKKLVEKDEPEDIPEGTPPPPPKTYTQSRLAELSLIVDTQGVYKGEKSGEETEIRTSAKDDSDFMAELSGGDKQEAIKIKQY